MRAKETQTPSEAIRGAVGSAGCQRAARYSCIVFNSSAGVKLFSGRRGVFTTEDAEKGRAVVLRSSVVVESGESVDNVER
jgi:hypothetical protein